MAKLFVQSVKCPTCGHANDFDFRFVNVVATRERLWQRLSRNTLMLSLTLMELKCGCSSYFNTIRQPVITKGSSKLRVDAGGEDWWHWKNLLEIRFAKETTCLLFSMSDFPQFIFTFICCVKQMKPELISWAHSSLFISIFEISKTG